MLVLVFNLVGIIMDELSVFYADVFYAVFSIDKLLSNKRIYQLYKTADLPGIRLLSDIQIFFNRTSLSNCIRTKIQYLLIYQAKFRMKSSGLFHFRDLSRRWNIHQGIKHFLFNSRIFKYTYAKFFSISYL